MTTLSNRELLYRTLWGDYASISCLPEPEHEALNLLAANSFIDWQRLADLENRRKK